MLSKELIDVHALMYTTNDATHFDPRHEVTSHLHDIADAEGRLQLRHHECQLGILQL